MSQKLGAKRRSMWVFARKTGDWSIDSMGLYINFFSGQRTVILLNLNLLSRIEIRKWEITKPQNHKNGESLHQKWMSLSDSHAVYRSPKSKSNHDWKSRLNLKSWRHYSSRQSVFSSSNNKFYSVFATKTISHLVRGPAKRQVSYETYCGQFTENIKPL